jgi:hypothetical protein
LSEAVPFSVTWATSLAPSAQANSSAAKNFRTLLPWAKKSQHQGVVLFHPARRTRNLTGLLLLLIAKIAKNLHFAANFGKRKAATSKDTGAA